MNNTSTAVFGFTSHSALTGWIAGWFRGRSDRRKCDSSYITITVPANGRFLVITRNGRKVTSINAESHSLIDAHAASRLQSDIFTTRNALAELQGRLRIINGEEDESRLDKPLRVY